MAEVNNGDVAPLSILNAFDYQLVKLLLSLIKSTFELVVFKLKLDGVCFKSEHTL